VWVGRIKDAHSKKTFDLAVKYVAGTKMVLRKLFPKTMTTNGRIRFENVDSVLPMLKKKSQSKSHLMVKVSCKRKDQRKDYDRVFEKYEDANRGMVIDMKSKYNFKMYIFPPRFDADECQIDLESVRDIWGTDPPEGQPWGYVLYYHKKK